MIHPSVFSSGLALIVFTLASASAGTLDLNPLNGGLEAERSDLSVGEGSARFELNRTHQPELGSPWHWSCDSRLVLDSSLGLIWIDEAGAAVTFAKRGDRWLAKQGALRPLRATAQGYELVAAGRTYRFNQLGQLVSRMTRGVELRFVPGPFGPTAVRGPWGQVTLERGPFGVERAAVAESEVRYAYRDGLLVGTERGPLRETYSYDDRGRLNRADQTRVHYDASSRVTHLVGGRVPLTATYAEDSALWVCEVRDGAATTRYSYDDARRSLEVAEADGSTVSYTFDARLRPRAVERAGQLERSWRYDRQGRLTVLHSRSGDLKLRYAGGDQPSHAELPNGEELRFVYDEAGRLLASTRASGTERFAYDSQGQLIKHLDANGQATHFKRDAHGYLVGIKTGRQVTHLKRSPAGDVLAVKHPNGRTVDYVERGAAVKVVDTQGTVQASAFDAQGRMIAYQDEFGRASRVDYNDFGLIARAYDKDGDRFSCDYDAEGQLVSVTDATGNTVRYSRPDAHTLVVTDPSAGTRTQHYNAEGQVVSEVRGESTLRFRYDADGRLLARTTPAGEERFSYDRGGRLISQAGPDGELRYTYDAQGRLLSTENRVLFQRISYRYQGASTQPSEVIYPWGSVRYSYNRAGDLTEVVAGEQRVQIKRGRDGRRQAIRYSNGVETRFDYAEGRLAEVASWRGKSLLTKRSYGYTARGRIERVVNERDETTTFAHDRRGRLLSAKGPETTVSYAYDAAGNRTAVAAEGEQLGLKIGAGNRVLGHAGATYTYGAHGAVVAREDSRGTWHYDVDTDGRLRGAKGPEGQSVRYGYAPDGTPLWREVDGERECFLVDREQVVGEFTDGALQRSYVRGEGLDDVLLSESPESETYAFHRDLVGSVTALTNQHGKVVARYSYGAFGEAVSEQGPAAASNRLRFAGRPLDATTGLYDVRARHYDPALGRFTAPDPSGRAGGLNLYAYAENDPTRLTDPLGLSAELGMRSEQTAAPKQGLFSRMWSAVDRMGQRLPGPLRTQYNFVKGVAQAGKDTVIGIGELFKKETWVALGEFVSELDDWETVKAVGKHLVDAGMDVGERYVDAFLNDPDEFARMTGYGAGMIAGSVLGAKGVDKLAKVARAAKAARAARRAAEAAEDVADANKKIPGPLLPVAGAEGAVAGATTSTTAGATTSTTAGATTTSATGSGAATAKRGIAQALDETVPLGAARSGAKKLNDKLTAIYDDYFDNDLPDEQLVSNVQKALADSDLPDAFKKELAELDDYYALSDVVRPGGEDLLALANSSDEALRNYALELVKARRSYAIDDKQFRAAIRDAEKVQTLPAVQATEITNGSGGLGRIFTGEVDGKPAIFKFDRSVDYDATDEMIRVAEGLEPYGGPQVFGRVRVQDSNGVWREAVAMEKIDGHDLLSLKRKMDAGEELPLEITPAHTRAIDEITERLAAEGKILEETNLGDFMLTNDPNRPVVLLDMFVRDGTRAAQGLLDHNGAPVRSTIEALMGGGN